MAERAARALSAVSVELPPGEPLDDLPAMSRSPEGVYVVFKGRQLTVLAAGAALALRLPAFRRARQRSHWVLSLLSGIAREDDLDFLGTGPLVLGALGFDQADGSSLFVPEVSYCRDRTGREWVTLVGDGSLPAERAGLRDWLRCRLCTPSVRRSIPLRHPSQGAGPLLPHTPRVEGLEVVVSDQEFASRVEVALGLIEEGRVRKLVLARTLVAMLSAPLFVHDALERLVEAEPGAVHFAVSNGEEGIVGATPETLVALDGRHVVSEPLAGTASLVGDPVCDDATCENLLSSKKDRYEHSLVVDEVAAKLLARCKELHVPTSPRVVRLERLAHLATRIEGTLQEPAAGGVLELADMLHPTPAVVGSPEDAALQILGRLEPEPRGLYAGPVGWMDARGGGEMVLAIRSMQFSARRVVLSAGAGIVAGSVPAAEVAETWAKLATALAGLGVPAPPIPPP